MQRSSEGDRVTWQTVNGEMSGTVVAVSGRFLEVRTDAGTDMLLHNPGYVPEKRRRNG